MSKESLKNCRFVKVVLMLLVIICHSCAFWSGNWFTANPVFKSDGLKIAYSWLNSFHIYAFTLVSGYLFAYKISGGGYKDYLPFLEIKVKRLLIPYLFVATTWVVPISMYFLKWDLMTLFRKFILCIEPSQLWFLWMLFDVFAIIWPIREIAFKNPILGWIITIGFYGIGLIGRRTLPNYFCIWTACQYILFFYIGIRIRLCENRQRTGIIEKIPWYFWIVMDLTIFISVTIFEPIQNGIMGVLINCGLTFLLHIIGAIMAWITLQTLANKVKWQNSPLFENLSVYLMPMYLFHQQFIYLTITALNGKVNPWINMVVNFTVATAGSYIISSFLMKWRFTRRLIGEKYQML